MTEDSNRIERKLIDVGESVTRAHQRIDSLAEDFSLMRADVHKITGQVEPMRHNLQTITDCIVEKGIATSPITNESVLIKTIDTIKWLIIGSVILGVLAAFGYYGLESAARSGDSELQIRKPTSE
jgi:hypothetical protein